MAEEVANISQNSVWKTPQKHIHLNMYRPSVARKKRGGAVVIIHTTPFIRSVFHVNVILKHEGTAAWPICTASWQIYLCGGGGGTFVDPSILPPLLPPPPSCPAPHPGEIRRVNNTPTLEDCVKSTYLIFRMHPLYFYVLNKIWENMSAIGAIKK